MAELTLKQYSALGGFSEQVGTTKLIETGGVKITTLSIPRDKKTDTEQAISDRLGCTLPAVGKTSGSPENGARILRTSIDRLMVLHDTRFDAPNAEDYRVPTGLGYQVDQSDYWAMFELSGPAAVASLERTCRVNLDQSNFVVGDLARTMIEEVSTILVREETERFALTAPRSFSHSLAHTLLTSLRYVAA